MLSMHQIMSLRHGFAGMAYHLLDWKNGRLTANARSLIMLYETA